MVAEAVTRITGPMIPSVMKRPSWVPDDLFPYTSRCLEVEGQQIHYVDEGQGETLLLLHGNPTWSFVYREIIAALRSRFRCIAPDLPGFGLSQASARFDFRPASYAVVLAAFVRALSLERFTPVVQDWGGPIGLHVAAQMPHAVRALVIANTWAWPVGRDRRFRRFSRLASGRLGVWAIRRHNAFVNILLRRGARLRRLSRPVREAYRAPFATEESREPIMALNREILESEEFLAEVLDGLGALRAKPVQLLWGDRDMAFKKRELERFKSLFPNARAQVIPGGGLYIQEDAPVEVVDVIKRFFDEVVLLRGAEPARASAVGQ